MAIGEVSVKVVPDATDFWRSFRTRTSGQAEPEGRRQGEEFRRGLESAASRGVNVRVTTDTSRARSDVAALEAELRRLNIARLQPKFDDKKARTQIAELKAQLAGLSTRPDVNTARARAQLAALSAQVKETKDSEKSLQDQGQQSGAGLLQALLPLAPALAPLAGAAGTAGAAIGSTMASAVLAVLGFKDALTQATDVGARTAASVGAVKNALGSLEQTAAHAALPGLEASVAAITTQLPRLRQIVAGQATIAGDVATHLTRGIVAEFVNFGPVITAVSRDVDALAGHFETWATGPGGAQFAQTLASDYQKVRPQIISIEQAVASLLRAGSSSGLGIISLIGDLARVINSFPRPVLTAIIDGFLAFRAVSVASTAVAAVRRSFAGVTGAAQRAAAATQLAATQRAAAETAAAAVTAEAEATSAEAMLATAEAARAELLAVASSRGQLSADQTAQMQVQVGIADREIAAYAEVAAAARASAAVQTAAAEEAAAARVATTEAAGAASVGAVAGSILGPVGLAAGAVLLLTTAFGDNGQAAQQDAAQVDGYASALVNAKGAIDSTVRAQVAKNLADKGVLTLADQARVSQSSLTDAIVQGGSALQSVTSQIDAYMHAQGDSQIVIDAVNGGLVHQHDLFAKAQQSAADQAAATQKVTASERAHAAALHSSVGAYLAATDAAAKSTEKTQEQTVAFQLENDAASLLSQALKSLAGQNLDVATAQTSFQQSTNSAIAALKKGKDAITGHSDAALTDQQAIQGSVSAARSLADAVAKQSGSSDKAAAAYRRSRDALLSQLKAQGVLTPAVRKYINTLFDVKGVSDYLSKHPTKHDVQINAAQAEAKTRQLQAEIDGIRQRQAIGVGVNAIEAENEISRIQGMIDALHGKTVTITTISADGGSVSVGSGGRGYNASAAGSASWTRDGKLPPGLSTVGERGWELVSTDARGRSQVFSHAQSVAMTGMPQALPGFAAGTGGIVHSGKDWIFNGHRYASERAAQNAEASAAASAAKAQAAAAAKAAKAQVQSTNALPPDVHSIFGALSGSVGGMRSAVAAFIKDFKAAGATTRQIARATVNDTLLVANQQKLVAARSKLANITTYGDTVRGALTGSFDPTKSGSVADLISGYKAQTGQNNAYTREVNALRKRAKGNKAELGLINSLAASGQTASLESLFSGSSKDLASAGKAYSGYNQSVQGGVDAASTAKYGETQGQASKDVQALKDVSVTLLNAAARLGAAVARSHGSSGARVEREMEKFAHEMETLVRHGRH